MDVLTYSKRTLGTCSTSESDYARFVQAEEWDDKVPHIDSEQILSAELSIIKYVQGGVFAEAIKDIRTGGKTGEETEFVEKVKSILV